MIKQVIKFKDYEGNDRSATAWFNLSNRELMALASKYAPQTADLEAVSAHLQEVGDLTLQLKFIDDVLLTAYGERDTDGIMFKKSAEIRSNFENSVVYDSFFEQLIQDESLMKTFIAGVPQDQSKTKALSEAPRAN